MVSSEYVFPFLYRLHRVRKTFGIRPNTVSLINRNKENGDGEPKYGVPRIRLISNGIITLAASDEGHIYLFSKGHDLTRFPVNPEDMGDLSSSFSVLWSADGVCHDALGGRFITDRDGALYIKKDPG